MPRAEAPRGLLKENMNARIAKKIRRGTKHNFFEYVRAVKGWPWQNRLKLCWYILFGHERKPKNKKLGKADVWNQRRRVPAH